MDYNNMTSDQWHGLEYVLWTQRSNAQAYGHFLLHGPPRHTLSVTEG